MFNNLDLDDILIQPLDERTSLNNNAPLNLNNTNDFFGYQKNIFQNNSFSADEEEDQELPEYENKNYITPWSFNNENIFTFEPEKKETLIQTYNEILTDKHFIFEKKITDLNVFLKEDEKNKYNESIEDNEDNKNNYNNEINNENVISNNNNDNKNNGGNNDDNEKIESSNSKDNFDNNENDDMYDDQEEQKIIISISDNENDPIDDRIINEKDNIDEEKRKEKILKTDYPKEFFAFTKGGSNPYVNEIIDMINNDYKKRENICIDNDKKGVVNKLIGKKRKATKKKRRDKPDDIRKRLKSRFHKILKKRLNLLLRKACSKKEFDFMPQSFVSIIAIEPNKQVMNMKIKDLLKKDFIKDYKQFKYHKPQVDNKKYKKNLETLEYLDKNIDIKEKSKFNIIGEMKYWELLEEFFYSKEFENTVCELKKFEKIEYVKEYVNKARTYVKFFLLNKRDF